MCTYRCLLLGQVLAEESKYFVPAIHCRLRPVKRPMPIPNAVPGTVVAMELVRLAVLFEFGLVLVDLLGARRPVVVAEYSDQRAAKVLRHVDRRDRRLVVELLLAHHHAATP